MFDILNALALISNFILVPAITYGSQLALGALGVTIVYAVLGFSNFSHGETMSFGAMISILITWFLQDIGIGAGLLPTALIALPVSVIATILICLIFDKLVYKHYRKNKAEPITYLIVSVGILFILSGLIRFIIGPGDQNFTDGARFVLSARDFKSYTGLEQGISIRTTQLLTVIIATLVVIWMFWFLNKTKTGKSMRAYADNVDLSLLSGISPAKVVLITWILTGALAAIAGTLYGLDKGYKPFTYLGLVLPIFSAAIVGGVGNPVGAILGGYIIAFSELLITFAYKRVIGYLMPGEWVPETLVQFLSTDYKLAVSFLILVIVLIIRPTGIFNGRTL